MITAASVFSVLGLALVLWLVYFLVGKFLDGVPYQIIGIFLGLLFIWKALAILGIYKF